MNLELISTCEELKNLGEFFEVKNAIEKKIAPLKIQANSYEELFEILKVLRNKWVDFIEGPFVSESARLCFVLKHMEGGSRLVALGITDKHYANKNLARKWYKSLCNKVHSDKGGDDEAFKILKSIYDILVDDSFGESDER